MKKLNDFGEKIGGAKKDLWALFNSLSNEEQGEMAQKTKLWKRPDYRAMVQEGTPKEVCFWQCQMRKAVVSRPKMDAATYVKFVIEFKADIEACNSIDDIKAFYTGYPEETERDGIFKYLIKASSDPDDKRWRYASDVTKPFFDGNVVLRYVYRPKFIATECRTSGFLEESAEKENAKYSIVEAAAENIKSERRNDGTYKNTVTSSDAIRIYYDTKDYSELVKESGKLFLTSYAGRKIGVFMSAEEADEAVKGHKEKLLLKRKRKRKKHFCRLIFPRLKEQEVIMVSSDFLTVISLCQDMAFAVVNLETILLQKTVLVELTWLTMLLKTCIRHLGYLLKISALAGNWQSHLEPVDEEALWLIMNRSKMSSI